jgi:ankyrin repeat protein
MQLSRCHSMTWLIPALCCCVLSSNVSAQAIFDAVKRNDLPAVKRMLLADPRSVSATDGIGDIPLHWAAEDGYLDMVRLLIQSGADVNARQPAGWTALHFATKSDRVEVMRLLLQKGANIDARNGKGDAPIHIAAGFNVFLAIRFLLSVGVDVDTPNVDGDTPLAVAARNDSMRVGRFLIAAGADIHLKNKAGKTALEEAARFGKTDFVKLLTEYQEALDERKARDTARKYSSLTVRTSYAHWTDPKATTKTMYHNDFGSGRIGPEWISTPIGNNNAPLRISTTPTGARYFLGDFGNQAVLLNLPNLPEHREIAITFDLFILRTWDGNDSNAGPDVWSLSVMDGPTLLLTTFSNDVELVGSNLKIQAYPGEYPGDHNVSFAEAAEKNTLGYTIYQVTKMDAVYRLRYTFTHSSRAILFRFAANNLEPLDNESWGITNVEVSVDAPPALALVSNTASHATTKPKTVAKPTRRAASHHATVRSTSRAASHQTKTTTRHKMKSSFERLHEKKHAPKP